jgi:cytoskeletal protein CcmA (bactofilin family)
LEYSEIPATRISGSGRVTLQGFGTVKVSGSGSISPERISTSGSSTIPGGLHIGELKTSGSSRVEGEIHADRIEFSGSASIDGDAHFDQLRKSGSLEVDGGVYGNTMRVSGSTTIRGDATIADELGASGSIRVGGRIESRGFVGLRGVFEVRGRVKARHFEGRLGRRLSVAEEGIEADVVDVEPLPRDWEREGELRTKDIVGVEEVTIENVECENIRGGRVVIHGGCRVNGKVEYTESIEVNPNSYLAQEPVKIV